MARRPSSCWRKMACRSPGSILKAQRWRWTWVARPPRPAWAQQRLATRSTLPPGSRRQDRKRARLHSLSSPVVLPFCGAAVWRVQGAIEMFDSRISDLKISFADTVADNGSSAFFVLAENGLPLTGLDLEGAAMEMDVGGKTASTGVGAAALGNPLNAAAWLAQTLARKGEPLKAGDILLAGALGPMVALKPGDHVQARIAGIGECSFPYGTGACPR